VIRRVPPAPRALLRSAVSCNVAVPIKLYTNFDFQCTVANATMPPGRHLVSFASNRVERWDLLCWMTPRL
jgi:hypothetical protein